MRAQQTMWYGGERRGGVSITDGTVWERGGLEKGTQFMNEASSSIKFSFISSNFHVQRSVLGVVL
jgi:hypothetical protein